MALASSPRPAQTLSGYRAVDWSLTIAPGLTLCAAVAATAMALQGLEQRWFGHTWLESLVLAILVGMAIRSLWTPPAACRAGINFGARTVLEIAVMLLGVSVSASTIMDVGWALLIGIVAIVMLAIAGGFAIGRAFGLPRSMALLVACGNSICGNSAIAAVAPLIGAGGQDVTAAIAFTALLGVASVLGLPLLGAVLHLSALKFGVLSGLTVYAVPQVLAAAASAGAVAIQIGTLVKLVRVLMLGPVCFVAVVLARRWAKESDASGATRQTPSLLKLAPWFIFGFLGLATLRTLGALPALAIKPTAETASILTVVSMAALGLCTDLRCVARAGTRVAATATLSLLGLGALSLGLIAIIWR